MAEAKKSAGSTVARVKRAGSRVTRARRAIPHSDAGRLRESREQFRLAQETLGIVTWVWDIRSDRVQWYGDPAALLGLGRGAFSGRFVEYLACMHPEDLERARERYVDCLRGRVSDYRAVERVIWPDESVHWLETYGRAEQANGKVVRMMGVVKDVTERKREEAARLKAESLFERVFADSPEYIVIARESDGRFIAVNAAFERATGYRAADVVGRTSAEVKFWAVPEDRERWIDEVKRGGARNRPVQFRARSGAILEGTISTSLIEHDGDRLVVSIVHDLTEKRQLARAAGQLLDKYEALFAASPAAIAVARRRDGVMLEVNDAWVRAMGYSHDAAVGRSAFDLGMWRRPALRQGIIEQLDAEGSVNNVPVEFVRRDGTAIDVLLSGSQVALDGEACVVWSWTDISRQRTIEQKVLQVERKAHEAERKFTALFDSSPIGLIVTRPRDRRVVEVNDVALELLGLERGQAVGALTLDLGTIVDREQFERLRQRALSGERGLHDELTLVRRDGRKIDLLFSTALVRLEGEDHLVVSIVDVTEHRRAQRERVVADARYRRLFESAREGMFITSPDNTVLDANPAAFELTGFAPHELIGRNAALLYSQDELRRRPLRGDLTQRWASVDRMLTRKDGRKVDIEVAAGPMPDGNVLAIVRDITERKRGETLLMNVARGVSAEVGGAFFRSLVEHLARELGADFAFIGELVQPAGDRVRTLAFVADGKIEKDFEYLLEGSPCLHAVDRRETIVHPQGVAELYPQDVGLARRGIQAYVGTSLTGAGGAALGVLVVMHRQPIQRGAYWASMIEIFAARAAAEIERSRAEALVFRTNTHLEQIVQERTAELEEANRELESYNFSISHDLRQPLNAISGFSELLRESGEAGRGNAQEYVREIEMNAARMEQMIEALLQLARAGRGTLGRERVDTRALVEAVVRDHSAAAAAVVRIGDLPDSYADPVLLRQVWSNLIGNALKYSRRSAAPRVEISATRGEAGVEYSVRDNGVGFDMRHARRLFSAFQRLPSAAEYEGTGVGLAIVERIVRRHGGSISAEAQPGRGATFRFSLPDEAL